VTTATAVGASHRARDAAGQDAVAVTPGSGEGPATGPLVAAVADGHGHWKHFRSGRGAQFAVDVACAAALEAASEFAACGDSEEVISLAASVLAPGVLTAWREAVTADVAAAPIRSEERPTGEEPTGDSDPVVAYGTTLLMCAVLGRWIVLAQIGDGDIVVVTGDGKALTPVPIDPSLDGRISTSLCQSTALSSFRYAAIDQESTPVSLVMLATDGYGNSQVADPWQPAVGEDLYDLVAERGWEWVREALPTWVSRCASNEGSRDDTTVALAMGPSSPRRRESRPAPTTVAEAGSNETVPMTTPRGGA
jgi:serine/threonine protein phosphatase PrpC